MNAQPLHQRRQARSRANVTHRATEAGNPSRKLARRLSAKIGKLERARKIERCMVEPPAGEVVKSAGCKKSRRSRAIAGFGQMLADARRFLLGARAEHHLICIRGTAMKLDPRIR